MQLFCEFPWDREANRWGPCARCGQPKNGITATPKMPIGPCRGKPGWGDKLAAFLTRIGIKKCGGCGRRAGLLNRFQRWLFGEK